MGTVRVVIAEGINQGRASSVSFVKLRNIVTFAFQHAPLREFCSTTLQIGTINGDGRHLGELRYCMA